MQFIILSIIIGRLGHSRSIALTNIGGQMKTATKSGLIGALIAVGAAVAEKIDWSGVGSGIKNARTTVKHKRDKKKDLGVLLDALRNNTTGAERELVEEGDLAVKALDKNWKHLDTDTKLRAIMILEMINSKKAKISLMKIVNSEEESELTEAAMEVLDKIGPTDLTIDS